MNRSSLKIGQKVRVTPKWTNKSLPKPSPIPMYVRDLSSTTLAVLSRRLKDEKVYGILYSSISPY